MPASKSKAPKGQRKPRKSRPTKPAEEQSLEQEGVLVVAGDGGAFQLTPMGGLKPREIPTVLRQAAIAADRALEGEVKQ